MKNNHLIRTLIIIGMLFAIVLTLTACEKKDNPPPDSYTISFDAAGGTAINAQTVKAGNLVSIPNAPTREGFVFVAWTFNGVDYDFTAPVNRNMTLVARWQEVTPTHTVTFVDADGTVLKTETVDSTMAATAPDAPTRSGYMFTGWDMAFDRVTSDITVTAQYVRIWVVQFVDYNGEIISSQEVTDGEGATAPADPTREGYTFTGWDKAFDNITADTTVTAQYTEIIPEPPAPTTYTVKFIDHDGTILKTETVAEGEGATAPADPAREGYIFTGWDKAFDNITADTTVTAQYTEIIPEPPAPTTYTVIYIDDIGNELKRETVTVGTQPVAPFAPYKAHHAFVDWEVSVGSIESGTVTYRAVYTPIRHVVTFNHANGTGETTPISVDDCTAVTAVAAPAYEGYTFLYWMNANGERYDFDTLVTKDITLTAKYERGADIPAATTGNIVISPGYLEFWAGLELRLNIQANVTYTASAGSVSSANTDVHYEGMTFTFYTDNPDVLTIAEDGTITPVSVGTARVWAVIHTGGTQTYDSATDYVSYDTFTVADGTVLSPIEICIIEKPAYLQEAERDPENQQIQLPNKSYIDLEASLAKPVGDYGSANIALWYNDATAVFTLTVDDNLAYDFNQWCQWAEDYNIPISIMAFTRQYQDYGNRWSDMTAMGNEVQPHGHHHYSSSFYKSPYITSAQGWMDSYMSKKLMEDITGNRVLILSYPCGFTDDYNKLLYIGGRGVGYTAVNSDKPNYYSVNLQNIPTEAQFDAFFTEGAKNGNYVYAGWLNLLQHGIGGSKSSYEAFLPLAKERIDAGELWAALFSAACQYGQERDSATLTVTSAEADVITFTLTDKMNDLLFDHALTVKIKVDGTWNGARAYQNGVECETRIVTEDGETYVYVNAVPDQGEVKVIRSAVENLTLTDNRITFIPAGVAGNADESLITLTFTVDGNVWINPYVTQNGKILPATLTTRAGATTLTISCHVGDGEVIAVPVTDQYATRDSLTMQEVHAGLVTPDGTKPVLISSAEDLVLLSDYINTRGVNAGVTFRLTRDIDMSGINFTPIGWKTSPNSNGDLNTGAPFAGIFDGGNYTIYNLTISRPNVADAGLFGYAEGATIQNTTVIGSVTGLWHVGGIAGRMFKSTMSGVTFRGSVTSYGMNGMERTGSYVGGLIGQTYTATVKNCAAYASVVAYSADVMGYLGANYGATSITSGNYIGGIVGDIYYQDKVTSLSTFDNVIFEGTVTAHKAADGTGSRYVGGFAGRTSHLTATNVTVHATVVGGIYVGGFAGHLDPANFHDTVVKNCSVAGSVTGDDYVGGFTGRTEAQNPMKLYNTMVAVTVNAAEGATNVGQVFGVSPYGVDYGSSQNVTVSGFYYIHTLNGDMVAHPGTVNTTTKTIPVANVADALTSLNTYASANGLNAWRITDGIASATYFPLYTVTFLDKNGGVIDTQVVGSSLNAVLPEAPVYAGFEFAGWSANHENITKNTVIHALYTEVVTHTVTFLDKDGGVIETQIVNDGRGAIAPTPTEYERFWFTGWDTAFDNITEDLIVTAQYTDAYYVTFSYKAQDGTETSIAVKVQSGTGAAAPTLPATEGYAFTGWDTAFDNVTADITVTAEYVAVSNDPVSVNVLQWSLTSNPSDAYYNYFTGSDVVIYTGNKDLSTITLPEGWAVVASTTMMSNYESPSRTAILYNTAKYAYDEAAGLLCMSALNSMTNGSLLLAVPLIDLATNKQIVICSLVYGTNPKPDPTQWSNATRTLNQILPLIATRYANNAGIVIGLTSHTKYTNTGLSTNYSAVDKYITDITGYDLVAQYETATSTATNPYANYALTYLKDGIAATLDSVEAVDATEGVSTYSGMRYTITFSEDTTE